MSGAYPTTFELIRFEREYAFLQRLTSEDGIIEAYDLLEYENRLCMVLEDFGGEALSLILKSDPPTVTETLDLMHQLVPILDGVHQQGITKLITTP